MESFRQIVTALFSVLVFTGHLSAFDVLSTPDDAAGRLGNGSMQFNCSSSLTSSTEVVTWTLQTVGSSTEVTLYAGTKTSAVLTDPNYVADDLHNLQAHNLSYSMAGTYKCKIADSTDPFSDKHFSVYGLVLDALQCSTDNVTYIEGDVVTMNCSVTMAGSLNPDITLLLNDTQMDAVQTSSLDRTSSAGSDVTYTYTHNISAEDDGANFTCSLSFSTSSSSSVSPPSYTDSCVTVLDVQYGVRDAEVSLSGNDSTVYVGDVITCTARGNPQPEMVWYNISGGVAEVVAMGSGFNVTTDMIGENEFQCRANNTVADIEYMDTISIAFTVVSEKPDNGAGSYTMSWLLLAALLLSTSL